MKLVRLVADVRFALRLLRRQPGFAGGVLALLALGIGATTAMFSIVSAFYLRPLPYPRPDDLGVLWFTRLAGEQWSLSLPDAVDIDRRTKTLTGVATLWSLDFSMKLDDGPPVVVRGLSASGNFFDVFEVPPLKGRVFHPDDDRLDGPKVVVLAEEFWRKRLASDPNVVGRTLAIDGDPYVVIGVAAAGFRYCGSSYGGCSFWTPFAVSRSDYRIFLNQRGSHSFQTVMRRRPGVSRPEAEAELATITTQLAAEYPDTNEGFGAHYVDLHEEMLGSSRKDIELLFAAVALVFAVVCANIANLLLARSNARRPEMAARLALGATRGQIITQLLTETVVAFGLGGIAGAFVARLLVGPLVQRVTHNYAAENIDVSVDARSFAFAFVIALVTGVLAGLAPALEVSRLPPRAVLESSARVTTRRGWLRGALVVLQVGLAFALLLDSASVTRKYAEIAFRDPGFDAKGVATGYFVLPLPKYEETSTQRALLRESIAKITAFPGVESVAISSAFPVTTHESKGGFAIDGGSKLPLTAKDRLIERVIVTTGYFETLRIPIVRGRSFTVADTKPDAPLVIIVSQRTAEVLFPGQDPIGHRIDWMDHRDEVAEWREIIGVAADVRARGLQEDYPVTSYVLSAQHETRWMAVLARTSRGPELLAALPRIVADIDPTVGVSNLELLEDQVAATLTATRFTAVLLIAFSIAAMILAALGVFSLVSYTTSLRTREIGLRIALGATPANVLRLIVREGARLVAIGLVLGLVVHVAFRRSLDVRLTAGVFLLLALAGLVATLLPALRAARMNPAEALKTE